MRQRHVLYFIKFLLPAIAGKYCLLLPDSREICIFSGTDQRKVLFKHTEIKKFNERFYLKKILSFSQT